MEETVPITEHGDYELEENNIIGVEDCYVCHTNAYDTTDRKLESHRLRSHLGPHRIYNDRFNIDN